jgi:2-oxoglutarate dehydrogenase E1 component
MKAAIAKYSTSDLRWVQDEPANQGPWTYMGLFMPRYGINFKAVSRPASASPATGSSKRHAAEQADVIARAFAD